MPIRFRCAYCNQLLGIAHRKAGTIVRCPTCAGHVIVPHPTEPGTEPPAEVKPEREKPLFERSDFDEVFRPDPNVPPEPKGSLKGNTSASLPPSVKWVPPQAGEHTEAGIDVERAPEYSETALPSMAASLTQKPGGLKLTPRQITFLALAAVVGLLLAFGAGLLVNAWLRTRG